MPNFGAVNTLAINTAQRSQVQAEYDAFVVDEKRQGIFFMELPLRRKGEEDLLSIGPAAINTLPVNVTKGASEFQPNTETVFFSSRNWIGKPNDALKPNTAPHRRLKNAFRLTKRVPFSDENSRRIQFSVSTAIIDNSDRSFDYLIYDSIVTGFKASLYHGDRQFDFVKMRRIAQPVADGVEGSTEIRISFKNDASTLLDPLQAARFLGTGGLEGTPDLKGKVKPLIYGEPFHYEPVLINPPLLIYLLSADTVTSVLNVWDGGIPLLFYQDYPSYEALAAATIPSGYYATCLAFSCMRLAEQPQYVIGCTASATELSSKDACLSALNKKSKRPFSQMNVSSFSKLSNAKIGWYNQQREITVETFLNEILAVENAFIYDDQFGRLAIGKHIAPEDLESATEIRLKEEQVIGRKINFSFVKKQEAGYGRVWRTLSENEFAGAVTDEVKERLREQYLYIEPRLSPGQQAIRENSVTATKRTFWVEESVQAAIDQADNDVKLFGRERVAYKLVDVGRQGLIMEDGRPFKLFAPVFGMENGKIVIPIQSDQVANNKDGVEQVDMEIIA